MRDTAEALDASGATSGASLANPFHTGFPGRATVGASASRRIQLDPDTSRNGRRAELYRWAQCFLDQPSPLSVPFALDQLEPWQRRPIARHARRLAHGDPYLARCIQELLAQRVLAGKAVSRVVALELADLRI